MSMSTPIDVCVIGSGPAGLAAAEAAAAAGARVLVAEQKPSFGRKFLMAGKSGLNLTKAEPPEVFRGRVDAAGPVAAALRAVSPETVCDWAEGLGQPVFTGSSGRVFPKAMKASPLLRAWLVRLSEAGVEMRARWRWTGWQGDALSFDTPEGVQTVTARATVLALGGASWARLGSDGAWAERLGEITTVTPFQPSNMGLQIRWSAHMQPHHGAPVKSVGLRLSKTRLRGEFVVSATGVEGSAIYALSAEARAAVATGDALLRLDLAPDLDPEALTRRLSRPRGKASLSNHIRKTVGITGVKAALLREAGPLPDAPGDIAGRIKDVPLHVSGLAPMDKAISTIGGIGPGALDDTLMLRARPGLFCAGEMLDWDAPTGGYLITTCLATGWHAGREAAGWAAGRE
ncbi:TIGR03862 family flavoprotein [Oceanibium sediminis]|uniref:TIGR03862 family flavoprotein n=1 Tax=Oceanibium sediminis TaxID=2026339 RepID=UPI001E2A034E|nr:TIGR03862 family flavoprotein [Oceanibium sediminis]